MLDGLKLIAKGAAFVFAGFFVSKLLSFFYRVILARFWEPSELGIFSIGLAVLGIVTVFGAFGLYQGVLHFVAVYESQNKKEEMRGTILGSLKLQLFTSMLFAAVLFLSAETIALRFFNEPRVAVVLQILAFTIPFQIVTSHFMILAQAFKRIEYKVLLRNILENIAKLVLTFLFAFYGFGAAGASIALALSAAFAFAVSFYLIQTRVYPILQRKAKAVYNMKELFGYSWPLFAVGFFTLLIQNIDTISLGMLGTIHDTGIYNVATPTARILEIPAFALGALFLPVATGLYASKKMGELGKTYKTITRWVFSLEFPCALFTALFAGEILSIMFGSVYAKGAVSLAILGFGVFAYSTAGSALAMLESISKTKLVLLNTIAAAVLNICLNIALIPVMGMGGAALASAASYFVIHLLAVAEIFLATRMHPYGKAYLKPAMASVLAVLVFYALKQSIPAIDSFSFVFALLSLIFLGIAFLAVYALILLVIKGLQHEDIEILKAIENKTGFRVNFLRNIVKRFSA